MERKIQVIKERMQAHHANLPFPSFTSRMSIELDKNVVMLLNDFPPKRELSTAYSAHTIMTGKDLDLKRSFKLHFGAYAQVHEDRNVMNKLEESTQGAIYLGATGNLQRTDNLFLLCTVRKINRGKFTEVPTPMIAMKRLTEMALAKK